MTAELAKALCAFHKDVSTIHEEAVAQYGKYADLSTVLSTVLPALSKNGLAVVQTFEPGDEPCGHILVTSLLHSSGERIDSRTPLVISKKNNPLHEWGGSVTYTRRYALLAILSLAAGIKDDDGDFAENPAPQVASASKLQPAKPKTISGGGSVRVRKLLPDEALAVRQQVAALPEDLRNSVVAAFVDRFGFPKGQKVSDYITTEAHKEFLLAQVEAHAVAS